MISRTSRYHSLHLGSFASYEGIHSFNSQKKDETSSDEEDECASLNEELRVTAFCRCDTIEERDLATTNAVRKELLMKICLLRFPWGCVLFFISHSCLRLASSQVWSVLITISV